MAVRNIDVIILDPTQLAWVQGKNSTSDYKATICGYNSDYYILYEVMTLPGYEDFATYFDGVSATSIEVQDI